MRRAITYLVQYPGSWIFARLRAAHRRKVSRQSGFALLVVTVTLAMLGAVVGEFSYNARVELESANNARDQMRAEYLARSGINLSRLLIKVQQRVLDPNRQFLGDIQIADFAPYLVKAFGGAQDEREGIGALLGVDATAIKGLGVGKDASFDVEMTSEDGRVNINCGGGLNPVGIVQQPPPGAPQGGAQKILNRPHGLYMMLTAMMFPPRYNRMFEDADIDGQYWKREDVARAVIDWSDIDETRYEPLGPSSAAEDYRYDAKRDPYKAHNHFYDTADELHLVRGVSDKWWGSFGDMLTPYGSCKVNLNAVKQEHWPILSAIIRTCATNPNDPRLTDERVVAQAAQQVAGMAQLTGGLRTTGQFAQLVASGGASILSGLPGQLGGPGTANPTSPTGGATGGVAGQQGIPLRGDCVDALATVGPRKIYRIAASGEVTRPGGRAVQVRVKAVWDTTHFNQNTVSQNPDDRQGTWIYWRME